MSHITTVKTSGHIFTKSGNRLPGNDFRADGCLDCDFELLARNQIFQFAHQFTALGLRKSFVHN